MLIKVDNALFRLAAVVLILGSSGVFSFAQKNKDCKKLLKEEIRFYSPVDEVELNNVKENLDILFNCYYDTIDKLILSNSPVISALLIENAEKNKPVSYGDIKATFDKLVETPDYADTRVKMKIALELQSMKISSNNWQLAEAKMLRIGLKKEEVDEFKAYCDLANVDGFTYGQKMQEFRQYKKDKQIEDLREVKEKGNLPELCDTVGTIHMFGVDMYSGVESIERSLNCASQNNLSVVLYFNAYGSVNCRRMEDVINNNPEIFGALYKNNIVVFIICDDRKKIQEEEQYYSEILKDEITQIGERNLEYQMKNFESSSQPFFVKLNSKGEIIDKVYYSLDHDQLIRFFLSE